MVDNTADRIEAVSTVTPLAPKMALISEVMNRLTPNVVSTL